MHAGQVFRFYCSFRLSCVYVQYGFFVRFIEVNILQLENNMVSSLMLNVDI